LETATPDHDVRLLERRETTSDSRAGNTSGSCRAPPRLGCTPWRRPGDRGGDQDSELTPREALVPVPVTEALESVERPSQTPSIAPPASAAARLPSDITVIMVARSPAAGATTTH